MYAVFQIGSKQYRVITNQVICIERLDANIGDQVKFDQILVIKNNDFLQIGDPFIKNGIIIAEIVTHDLAKKIEIVKFHRRKHFRKRQGHRQYFTKIKIVSIKLI